MEGKYLDVNLDVSQDELCSQIKPMLVERQPRQKETRQTYNKKAFTKQHIWLL